MYMFVYTLYKFKLSMSGYGYVLCESIGCVCLCWSDEPVLFCLYICLTKMLYCVYVWMALWKISCKPTVSPSLNKDVFLVSLIMFAHQQVNQSF